MAIFFSLSSCSRLSDNWAALMERAKTYGYTAESISGDEADDFLSEFDEDGEDVETLVLIEPTAPSYGTNGVGCFIFCDNTKRANEMHASIKAFFEENANSFSYFDDLCVKIKGRIVFFGSEETFDKFD